MNASIDSKYLDGWNLIVTKDKDGGDTAQRMGMYYSGKQWTAHYNEYDQPLEPEIDYLIGALQHPNKPHIWRRHPDESKWYGDWDRMSRDNMTPIVIMLGLYGYTAVLSDFAIGLYKRFSFMTNTRRNWVYKDKVEHDQKEKYAKWRPGWKLPDICTFEFWGLIIRGLNLWWLYPVLILSDLEHLIGAIFRRLSSNKDVLNHTMIWCYINKKYRTPLIYLINRINKKQDLSEKLHRYFSPKTEMWPGMADLYDEVMECT